MAVARQGDVAEFEAAEQRSFKPSDLESGRQVLIGLANDQRPKLFLGPARLDHADDDADEDEDDGDENDEGPGQP